MTDFKSMSFQMIFSLLNYSCYWNGERCDLKRDFGQVITDLGVCYSFNSNQTNRPQYVVSEEGTYIMNNLNMICSISQLSIHVFHLI